MWRKQLILVLFAGVVISADFPVILDQTQRHESVPLGSSLSLKCSLKIPQAEQLRVYFYRAESILHDSPKNLSLRVITLNQSTSNTISPEELPIEEIYSGIANVTHEHSGWYFCSAVLEIPILKIVQSNGTYINITTKNLVENTTNPRLVTSKPADPPVRDPLVITWWMWIIVGASAFVLLVILVICILLGRRCHKSKDPEPIYLNTRPMVNKQPSPRPDNLKMAPASQQLRTPSPGRRYEEGNRRNRR